MEQRNYGMLEGWDKGTLEYWNTGIMECWVNKSALNLSVPFMHYSNTPVPRYSITPIFHHSIFLVEDPELAQPVEPFEGGKFFRGH